MGEQSEAQRFDTTVRKILSVSHDELLRREKEWKKQRAKKKRAKLRASSRASGGKD